MSTDQLKHRELKRPLAEVKVIMGRFQVDGTPDLALNNPPQPRHIFKKLSRETCR